MRVFQIALFSVAMLWLPSVAKAVVFTIDVANYDLLPNTANQEIPLYVTGIVPNAGTAEPGDPGNVSGMLLGVAISDGGVPFGGTPGPIISDIDVDSGPTIWVAPQSPFGHNDPHRYLFGQLAGVDFLTTDGFVNVTGGLIATLVIDTTGFNSGTYPLTLSGVVVDENLYDTFIIGHISSTPFDTTIINYHYFDGTAGQITIVPEPSSVAIAAIGLMGLAVWGWRRRTN